MTLSADRGELMRWVLSAAVVLALHGGIAAAIAQWGEADEAAEPSAAMVVDLAPFPVAPREPPLEIPPGPEQVEAQAAPDKQVERPQDRPEEKVEKAEAETRPEIASAPAPEVPLDAQPPEPEREAPTPQDNQTPAPATTAPQALPAETAPVAAAPAQGRPSVTRSNAVPNWKSQVVAMLERNKRYPAAAQARHEQGTAQLAFSLDRRGRVTSSRILKSSGSAALDQETLDLVRRAQPFPPPPPDLPAGEISLAVPIRFNIR